MNRSRLLVTGATGFIGCALVPRLMQEADVTLLLLEEFGSGLALPQALKIIRPHFDVVYADLRNYATTARAVRQANPEQVIHLAAIGTTDPFLSPHRAVAHNITGTLNLLRACFESQLNVRRLIVARTPGENSAMNIYAASKAAAWTFCEMYERTAGWPIVGGMIFQAYGPGQPDHLLVPAALRAALAGENFPLTEGRQKKDWIHIKDIVEGFVRLLHAELPSGLTVELGTGIATAVRDVVSTIYELVDRGGSPLYGVLPSRPGEENRQVANISRLDEYLNWRPATSLREGLIDLIANVDDLL
ncbi:MAG: GDP-mannose 4,6-dehydratase [Chloroflexota bacterium]|jgi:UDP-glucose 4-epimerase